jgi:hypothetical protein
VTGGFQVRTLPPDVPPGARACRASARVLEIAGEIQEIARLKKGIARAPGC